MSTGKEEWEKYKEEMRILEKEGLIWTSQQRVLEGKMEEELGLLEEDVWIIQTGPMVWEGGINHGWTNCNG